MIDTQLLVKDLVCFFEEGIRIGELVAEFFFLNVGLDVVLEANREVNQAVVLHRNVSEWFTDIPFTHVDNEVVVIVASPVHLFDILKHLVTERRWTFGRAHDETTDVTLLAM